jgi:hypothetical protein
VFCSVCYEAERLPEPPDALETTVARLSQLSLPFLELAADIGEAAGQEDQAGVTLLLQALSDIQRLPIHKTNPPEYVPLGALVPLVQRIKTLVSRIEGPFERRFLMLLAREDLLADFDAQGEYSVSVVTRTGAERRQHTWPDFVHRTLPYVIYVDGYEYHSKQDVMVCDHELVNRHSAAGRRVGRFLTHAVDRTDGVIAMTQVKRDIAELKANAGATYSLRSLDSPISDADI